jgi:hypothetical protein
MDHIPEDITLIRLFIAVGTSDFLLISAINDNQFQLCTLNRKDHIWNFEYSRYSNWLWAGWQRGCSSSPGRIKNFLHVIQTRSGAHPASYPTGTVGSTVSHLQTDSWYKILTEIPLQTSRQLPSVLQLWNPSSTMSLTIRWCWYADMRARPYKHNS